MRVSLASIIRPSTPIQVVDVGASLLDIPLYESLIQHGLARLTAFEPDASERQKIEQRYRAPHRVLPFFVGDGTAGTFYQTNWFATGSLFKPNKVLLEQFQGLHEVVTLVAETPVETKALDSIAEIGDIDYLKIDVQGAELSVFKGAANLLAQVGIIHTEVEFVELYEKQPLFADVDSYLRANGFEFVKFMGFGSRAVKPLVLNRDVNVGNQLLWADALYLRRWIPECTLSDDKLIKMAIIIHDLYGLVDICNFLLAQVDRRRGSSLSSAYLQLLTQAPHAA